MAGREVQDNGGLAVQAGVATVVTMREEKEKEKGRSSRLVVGPRGDTTRNTLRNRNNTIP